MAWSVLIKNGTVVDGSGAPGVAADVALEGDRIAAVGPALTGQCCLAIISRTSYGPAVSVFDPNDLGVKNPVPDIPLLYYPASHPLADWSATSPYSGSQLDMLHISTMGKPSSGVLRCNQVESLCNGLI